MDVEYGAEFRCGFVRRGRPAYASTVTRPTGLEQQARI